MGMRRFQLGLCKYEMFIQMSCVFSCSVVSDFFVTPWTVALQAPLSMGFPKQEY